MSPLTIRTGGLHGFYWRHAAVWRCARSEAACALGHTGVGLGMVNMLVSDEGFDGLVIHFGSGFGYVCRRLHREAQAGAAPAVSKMVAKGPQRVGVCCVSRVWRPLVMNAPLDSDMSGLRSVGYLPNEDRSYRNPLRGPGYGYVPAACWKALMRLSARLRLAPGNRKTSAGSTPARLSVGNDNR